jgi:outer membrane protein assembly factor BamB
LVFALNQDGTLKWQYGPIAATSFGEPAVDNRYQPDHPGGVVYIGANTVSSSYVLALHANNGTLKWSYTAAAAVYTRPTFAEEPGPQDVYIATADELVALEWTSGVELWTYSLGTTGSPGSVSSPVIAPQPLSPVFVGSTDASIGVSSLDALAHLPFWSVSGAAYVTSDLAVDWHSTTNETIYAATSDGMIWAISNDTGISKWTYTIHDNGATSNSISLRSPPVVGPDRKVYVGSRCTPPKCSNLFAPAARLHPACPLTIANLP